MKRSILVSAYHEHGSWGCETSYDEAMSIEAYIQYFQEEIKINSMVKYPQIFSLEVTVHNEDGSFKRREDHSRVQDQIYINKELQRRMFG